MATRWLAAATLVALLISIGLAVASESAWVRVALALVAVAIAFLLGLGVGDRAKSRLCQQLIRANSLLGEHVRALGETNLDLLRQLGGLRHDGAEEPRTPHQRAADSRTPSDPS